LNIGKGGEELFYTYLVKSIRIRGERKKGEINSGGKKKKANSYNEFVRWRKRKEFDGKHDGKGRRIRQALAARDFFKPFKASCERKERAHSPNENIKANV